MQHAIAPCSYNEKKGMNIVPHNFFFLNTFILYICFVFRCYKYNTYWGNIRQRQNQSCLTRSGLLKGQPFLVNMNEKAFITLY
jgi:hypothetical protein